MNQKVQGKNRSEKYTWPNDFRNQDRKTTLNFWSTRTDFTRPAQAG